MTHIAWCPEIQVVLCHLASSQNDEQASGHRNPGVTDLVKVLP